MRSCSCSNSQTASMRGRWEAQPEVACRSYRQFVFIIPKNILLGIFSALIIVTPVLTSLSDVTDDHPHGRKRVFLQVLRVILCGAPLVVDDGLPVGSLPTRPRCMALRAASFFLPLINRLSPRIAKAWPRPVTSVHPRAEAPPPSLLQDNRIPGSMLWLCNSLSVAPFLSPLLADPMDFSPERALVSQRRRFDRALPRRHVTQLVKEGLHKSRAGWVPARQ